QGVYGRQIPRLIADMLRAQALRVEHRSWSVPHGDERAHIAIESALPRHVLDEEADAHNAHTVLLGRVRVAPEDTYLHIARYRPQQDETPEVLFESQCAMHALPLHVEDAAKALTRFFSSSAPPTMTSSDKTPDSIAASTDEETESVAARFAACREQLLAADAHELDSHVSSSI